MDEAIRKAEERLADVMRDKEALRAYQMREMALSDWTSGINHAREEGEQKRSVEIASKMKKGGIPAGQIAEYTDLSVMDIEKL